MKHIIVFLLLLGVIGGYFYLRSRKSEIQAAFGKWLGGLPGSYQVKMNWNHGKKILTYRIKLEYPASPLVSYYDKNLSEKGLISLNGTLNGNFLRKWTLNHREDPKTKEVFCAYYCQAAWINEKKNRVTLLKLTYEMPSSGGDCPRVPEGDELMVTLEESPFLNELKKVEPFPIPK